MNAYLRAIVILLAANLLINSINTFKKKTTPPKAENNSIDIEQKMFMDEVRRFTAQSVIRDSILLQVNLKTLNTLEKMGVEIVPDDQTKLKTINLVVEK